MAYIDYCYPQVLRQFGLTWKSAEDLFTQVSPVSPKPSYKETVTSFVKLASTLNTEKARSEWIIALLLGDFWSRYHGQISLFSGVELNADPAAVLMGFCDFLITLAPQQPQPITPLPGHPDKHRRPATRISRGGVITEQLLPVE